MCRDSGPQPTVSPPDLLVEAASSSTGLWEGELDAKALESANQGMSGDFLHHVLGLSGLFYPVSLTCPPTSSPSKKELSQFIAQLMFELII